MNFLHGITRTGACFEEEQLTKQKSFTAQYKDSEQFLKY
jgi:hypothetical protein